MVTSTDRNSDVTDPLMKSATPAIAPLAMEMEVLVNQLEADLRQNGTVSLELADRVHELRVRAERLFA